MSTDIYNSCISAGIITQNGFNTKEYELETSINIPNLILTAE